MTLLNDGEIASRCRTMSPMIGPFVKEKSYMGNLSYGLSSFGYDVRLGSEIIAFKDMPFTIIDPADPNRPMKLERYSEKHTLERVPTYMLNPGKFVLGVTVETFQLPNNVCGLVRDKSTLARLGIAVQNTVLEPGWKGEVTLEITNHNSLPIRLRAGMPIAQIQFLTGNNPKNPYDGRYQGQKGITLPIEKE